MSRGFAKMTAEKQLEIARMGGKAAHAKGTAHQFTSDEAREAGRKGGERISHNRQHMARIGSIGGRKAAEKRTGQPLLPMPDTPAQPTVGLTAVA